MNTAGADAGRLVALRFAALVGLAAALVCIAAFRLPGVAYSDFDYIYAGARALIEGQDPYAAVERAHLLSPLYYPLPALLVVAPLTMLPLVWARAAMAGASAFALALAGHRWPRRTLAIALLSAGCWTAVIQGQWSPMLTASAALPALGALWVVKPKIGLALAIAYPRRLAIAGALVLLGASFLVMPDWIASWRHALGASIHVAPVTRPGGSLLLLGLLRWRRPEARLLVALACVPQMTVLYETVPLFLVPDSRSQAYLLAALSLACSVLQVWAVPDVAVVPSVAHRWPFVFVLVWIPALLMVLRRPNEGPVPALRPGWLALLGAHFRGPADSAPK